MILNYRWTGFSRHRRRGPPSIHVRRLKRAYFSKAFVEKQKVKELQRVREIDVEKSETRQIRHSVGDESGRVIDHIKIDQNR